MKRTIFPALLLAALALGSPPARAQDDPVTTLLRSEADRRDATAKRLADLERRVAALEAAATVPAPTPAPAPTPTPTPVPTPEPTPVPIPPPGTPRTFYISVTGSDARDGLSPATAKRSPGDCYELLHPGDTMLLKRGDVWDGAGSQFAFVGNGGKSDVTIGAYGTGARPLLLGGRFRPLDTDHNLTVRGLEFRQTHNGLASFAITWQVASCDDVTIEDCVISGYTVGVQVVGDTTHRSKRTKLLNCVIVDEAAQGVLLGEIDGLTIDGCVFDMNGWSPDSPATAFDQNMYLIHTSTDVTVRNCISARASANGLQQRPGGVCEDNLFLQNPISVFSTKGTIRWNVVLDSRDLPGDPRGFGIWPDYTTTLDCSDNIVAHQHTGTVGRGFTFQLRTDPAKITIERNIVWDWTSSATPSAEAIDCYFPSPLSGTISVKDNVFGANGGGLGVQMDMAYAPGYTFRGNAYGAARWFVAGSSLTAAAWTALTGETPVAVPTFPDPNRTIETYMASIGRTPTLDAFMADARAGLPTATARAVNNYIRAGFGRAAR